MCMVSGSNPDLAVRKLDGSGCGCSVVTFLLCRVFRVAPTPNAHKVDRTMYLKYIIPAVCTPLSSLCRRCRVGQSPVADQRLKGRRGLAAYTDGQLEALSTPYGQPTQLRRGRVEVLTDTSCCTPHRRRARRPI